MDQDNKTSTRNWRTAGGFLLSLFIAFFVTFETKDPYRLALMDTYPWLKYVFLAVLIAAAVVFFVIWKKERVPAEHEASNIAQRKKKVHFFSES